MKEPIAYAARYGHIRMLPVRDAVRRRALRLVTNEQGQTSTEYLMIVGLMAAVILLAFVTFFWTAVRGAALSWAGKVADAIMGTPVQ